MMKAIAFKPENRLKNHFLLIILLAIAVMFIAIYLFSVPFIEKKVFEIERNAARLALNGAYQLADNIHYELENYREQALASEKQRLQSMVEFSEHHIRSQLRQSNNTDPRAQENKNIFTTLSDFRYGSDGYVWVADYAGQFFAHPELSIVEQQVTVLDINQVANTQAELATILQKVQQDGAGYFQYRWNKPGGTQQVEKIAYLKDYPEWGMVIGSGVYLDAVDKQVAEKKQSAVTELRAALQKIIIAKTGYLYIFDKDGNIIAHPNPNIDQKNVSHLLNPDTGNPIHKDLAAISDSGKELYYKWDSPADAGNYIYDKLAFVRFIDNFGWYIASSVYLDELNSSSEELSQALLLIAFISVIVALSAAFFFTNHIFQPIKQLVKTAERINKGDLFARSRIQANNEIGLLSKAFDKMITRLQENIENLDVKVKESTQELASVEERQRLILDALPAQVAYINRDFRYVFVNRGYAEMFHQRKQDIIGKALVDVLGQTMTNDIKDKLDLCLQGEPVVYEYHIQHNDQKVITKRTLIPDFDANGQVIGVLNLSLDVTAEKEAAKRLTETNRINVAGQLAGGLAHDFNNLLSIILGNLQVLKERYDDSEQIDKYLDPAIRASLKGADITERLLTFARHQSLRPKSINPNAAIGEVVELLGSSIPSNVRMNFDLQAKNKIFIDHGQLENALVNIALNAIDAMPEGGEICFSTDDVYLDKAIFFDEKVPAGSYVNIIIDDQGHGFSKESLAKACEPFFTTKSHGKGTGLGLSMVHGFIKQSKGFITITSEADKGATVTILLPSDTKNSTTQDISETQKAAPKLLSKKLFLLVEDDDDVRAIIRDQLVYAGQNVIEAKNADEAESLLNEIQYLDGLITDINMPGRLNGFQLAEIMQNKTPNSTIVLITGYANNIKEANMQHDWTMLRKPFDQYALIKAINGANSATLN